MVSVNKHSLPLPLGKVHTGRSSPSQKPKPGVGGGCGLQPRRITSKRLKFITNLQQGMTKLPAPLQWAKLSTNTTNSDPIHRWPLGQFSRFLPDEYSQWLLTNWGSRKMRLISSQKKTSNIDGQGSRNYLSPLCTYTCTYTVFFLSKTTSISFKLAIYK